MSFDFPERMSRLREVMAEREIDAVVLSVGPDLPYLTGYEAMASERLTALVVTDEGTRLVIPELEAPRVEELNVEVVAWGETTNPIALLTRYLNSADSVAVGDHMWSVFLTRLFEALPGRKWSPASEITSHLRLRKEHEEISRLRSAAQAVDRVMARVPRDVRFSGRTEAAVARDLQDLTVAEGHDTAEFAIVASGPNGASPHHHPGERVIEEGDLVVCDFGGTWGGYYSDSTRTFAVGEPTSRQLEVHAVVAEANRVGREAVAPGVACQDVDRVARRVVEDAGFGTEFVHRTGHGIGLEVHESPYLVEGNEQVLGPGMTFSIEPGIYLAGEFGVRIEDIVVCTEDGVESLNRSERGLVAVS